MSKKNTKDITTSQLLTLIKKSNDFSEVTETYHDLEEEPLFCHFLYSTMLKHGKTAIDVITESGIERSYFYHVLSGQKSPGRNMVLRISLCLSATLAETNQLLRLARQGALYPRVKRDAAIIFAIEKNYTMQQANDLLIQEGATPLYKENREKE
ncbi:MAG: hypothetical protein LUH53_11330 [Lachnospiraceae bacterium]|nr:hypothetical protein [Lachnospiraceae bacterium]